MKKNSLNLFRWSGVLGAALLMAMPVSFTSCKEDISDDAYAIASKKTMTEYITGVDSLSYIKALFDEVRLGNTSNASTLTSVLSARGNYTVFAPTNSAVVAYVKELTGDTLLSNLSEEDKKQIALNCIIDNGTSNAYETADFPTGGNTFTTSNLRDRRLSCTQDSVDLAYVINGESKCIETNIEVSNGMLHMVNKVISPSTNSVAALIQEAENMKVMGLLLDRTGWADSLANATTAEEEYETEHIDYAGSTVKSPNFGTYNYRDKRVVSFTAFVEPDNVLQEEWGVPAPVLDADGKITEESANAIIAKITEQCKRLLPAADDNGNTAADDDLTNPSNVVNRFMAYHFLHGGMSVDKFVHHWNEYGYDYVSFPGVQKGYSVDVWDYYATMGKCRGLLKITQLPDGDNDYYLNRITKYNDGISGDYKEVSTEANQPGENGINIKIHSLNDVSGTNYDNNALNGFYYPIDHVLIYNDATRSLLANQRMRHDMTTILHEFISQSLRGTETAYFPNDYFSGITNVSSGTQIYYLQDYGNSTASNGSWKDYQGDEFLITGRYDFVMKLPPVPKDGTYELRMGVSLNTLRGMVQVYFGDSPDNTQPVGLPIDQRESVDMIPGSPWVDDSGLDEATIRENDRNLRNQSYMKAPNYFLKDGTKNTARNADSSTPALRRILATKEMKAGKTYYMRFKSAIESDNTQFILDYFEIVPTSIVTAVEPEDIW